MTGLQRDPAKRLRANPDKGTGTTGHHERIDSRRDPHDEAKGYTVRSWDDPAGIGVMVFDSPDGPGVTYWLTDDGRRITENERAEAA